MFSAERRMELIELLNTYKRALKEEMAKEERNFVVIKHIREQIGMLKWKLE
jgi:hypothetical protein